MDKAKKTSVRMKLQEAFIVNDKLREVCKRNAMGFAEYSAGWDDEKVAAFIGQPITMLHVRGIRRRTIGNLFNVDPGKRGTSTKVRLNKMQADIAFIEAYLTSRHSNWRDTVQLKKAED